ncbi:hypothetical protein OS493_008421 [Desmophyllum pertusum]|uniref:Uncharacterized protein n=1 Tax=Desmophyllum pertusum TaxID=174260 RepID=A0A9X0A489_9CNID|nr:hypothetical protein OS493_008421 [Desmophyllum pertusum]
MSEVKGWLKSMGIPGIERLSDELESQGFSTRKSYISKKVTLDFIFSSPKKLLLAEKRAITQELRQLKAENAGGSAAGGLRPKQLLFNKDVYTQQTSPTAWPTTTTTTSVNGSKDGPSPLERRKLELIENNQKKNQRNQNDIETDRKLNEEYLMKKLLSKKNCFDIDTIEKKITPKSLTKCVSNSLLMGMKVNYRLRNLAKSKGSEGQMFDKLANSVEDFTTRLLDPMQSNQMQREGFGYFILDYILDDAIELEQKMFFTHPVVDSEMNRKWRGRFLMKKGLSKWTWFFLHVWCLFDMVLAPIAFYFVSYLEVYSLFAAQYLKYLKTPYFIFVRDSLSYLALVVLHYAICLAPSSLEFSVLEWSILVFFMGRSLVEFGQIRLIVKRIKERRKSGHDETDSNIVQKALSSYIGDHWNKLDVTSVLIYLVIFILRLKTWITTESVTNNRAVLVAGYLYSFNTVCLTLRIFGHVVETFKGVGTIQIALFNILQDVMTIVWQFTAAVFAFSLAITKIYMAEQSFHVGTSSHLKL